MKKLILAFLLTACSIPLRAQTWQDTVRLIEKAFARYPSTGPGCQLSISRDGRIIYSKAWGLANLEYNVPLSTSSNIEAGSVSKQFTAAAILLLEQQGKLSLNDRLRRHFPELPAWADSITLRQMMQHTSGLKDWGSIAAIAGWPRSTKTYANNDALHIIGRQPTLNHKPGAEYIYSNSNYNLFAILVERVSGQSLAEFTRVHLFEPAGMKHTQWRDDFKRVVPNRAVAYAKFGNTYLTDMPNEYVYGNGGLLTTTEDLLAWNHFYLNGKLGNPSLLQKQLSTHPLNNGRPNNYAAGLVVNEVRGWKSVSHTGATAGYRASLEYFPELGLSIAWLSNSSEFDQGPDGGTLVREILVPNRARPPADAAFSTVSLPETTLNGLAGWYRNERTAAGVKLAVKDNGLAGNNGWALQPVSDRILMNRNDKVEFSGGKLLYYLPGDTLAYVKMADPDPASLAEYAGTYRSDEAEATYTIRLENGRLLAGIIAGDNILLSPTYRDGFSTRIGTLYFTRKNGRISTMYVYSSRARKVRFDKIK